MPYPKGMVSHERHPFAFFAKWEAALASLESEVVVDETNDDETLSRSTSYKTSGGQEKTMIRKNHRDAGCCNNRNRSTNKRNNDVSTFASLNKTCHAYDVPGASDIAENKIIQDNAPISEKDYSLVFGSDYRFSLNDSWITYNDQVTFSGSRSRSAY